MGPMKIRGNKASLLQKRSCARAAAWVLTFGALISAGSVCGQNYSINWYSIAGGGGTSSNGQYSLSGTIGQPAAGGPMTNGQFSITGGFWVLPVAVQTDDAPKLTIVSGAPGLALISWAPQTPGFVLQEALSLSPTNWTPSASGATNPVTVPATFPAKFYRLIKP